MSNIYKVSVDGGGGGEVNTLAGNSGGAIGPDGSGNINTLGNGSITIIGNPGTNTLTTELTGLTAHNVLVGAGTTTITNVAPSTAGFVLTSNGASTDPSFQTISTSGAVITVTGNSGGAESPLSGNFNVLGTGSITVAGSANTETVQLIGLTNHNVLVGAGTATITNIAPSATSGIPFISQGSSSNPTFGTGVVAGGCTGATSFTAYSPICGGTTTTGALQSASTGISTSGFVLTSTGASSLPSFQTISASGAATTITGSSGGAVSPNGSGNINVLGANTTSVVGNPGTNTLTITPTSGGYPITPYVVGPSGQAGYQTIQSAINAANTAGGGLVFIQHPGSYAENLTMFGGVDIEAAPCNAVIITGTHTPPTTGSVQFTNIIFESTTDIFSTTASSSLITITCLNCTFIVINGFTFNTPNLSATVINIYNCSSQGVNDGFLSGSSGGIVLTIDSSTIGAGSTHTLSSVYETILTNSTIYCPCILTGGQCYAFGCFFANNVTLPVQGDNALLSACIFGDINDFSPIQITINSTGIPIYFLNCSINTTMNPAITGAADSVYFSGVSFLNGATIANTITFATGDVFNCGSGIVTTPVSSASSSLSIGTAYRNTTGYDVLIHVYIAVTSATTASILCGTGPTTTPTQQTIVSGLTVAAVTIIPVNVYLPNNYYALISTSGTIVATISGQQITTV